MADYQDFDAENAEVSPQIPTGPDSDPEKPKMLIDYEPSEIKSFYSQGLITADQAEQYVAYKDMEVNGTRHMAPKNVKRLYSMGLLTEEQVESYVAFQKNPLWFTMKDYGKAIFSGARNFAEFTSEAAWKGNPIGILRGDTAPEFFQKMWKEKTGKDWQTPLTPYLPDPKKWFKGDDTFLPFQDIKPETGTGKVIETATEFIIPFGMASKGLKAADMGARVMGKLPWLAKNHPKLASFFSYTFNGTVSGAFADFTFDPDSGRVADLMKDYDILPEFLDFMQTNPDNPEALERFKNVVEGAILGVGVDAFLYGAKALKAHTWHKMGMDGLKVADDVMDKYGLFMEVGRKTEILQPEYTKLGRAVNALPDGDPAKIAGTVTPPDIRKVATKAVDVDAAFKSLGDISDEIAGKEVKTGVQARGIAKLMEETGGSAAKVVKHIYNNSETVMDIFRGGAPDPKTGVRKTRVETQEGADVVLKSLAQSAGRNSQSMADRMLKEMQKVGANVGNLDSVVRAFNQYFVQYADEVYDMAAKIVDENVPTSFADELRVLEHIKMLQEMQGYVVGIRSDIGRTLGQYNLDWMGSRFDFSNLPKENLTDLAAHQQKEIKDIISSFSKAKKHADRMKIARFTGRNKWLQGSLEFMQANLLWNPGTQAVNIIGNSLAQLFDGLMRHVAVVGDAVVHGDLKRIGELGAYYKGIGQGVADCFRVKNLPKWSQVGSKSAWKEVELGKVFKALLTGEGQLDQLVKLEGQLGSGMDAMAEALHIPKLLSFPIIKTIQLPFHALTAGDELFKNIGYHSELNALAYRELYNSGKRGPNLKKAVSAMINNPSAELHYAALNRARDLTFQTDFAQGSMTKKMNEMLNTSWGTAIKIGAIPFYKIAVNITKYSAQRSPLGLLGSRFSTDWAAGGVKRWEAAARVATGSAVMYMAYQLYDDQKITGRVPPGQQDAWQAADIQPYSLRVGNKWYSYDRFDPFGMLIGMAADIGLLVDLYEYNQNVPEDLHENLATQAILTLSEPVLNKTWMTGVQDILNLVLQPERMNIKKFGLQQGSKFFPGMTAFDFYNKNFNDTHIREMNEAIDIYHARLNPEKLIAKRHAVYGTTLERTPRLGYTVKVREMQDPVMLEMVNVQANMRKPTATINGVKLEPQEYAKLNDLISQMPIRETLEEVIHSPAYQSIEGNELKAKILKKVVTAFRNAAKAEYLAGSERVQQELISKLTREANNILFATAENNAVEALYHHFNLK